MAKSATLKVKVISTLPQGYTGVEGDELEMPRDEARKWEKKGYVRILWDGVQIEDMGTKKDARTISGLPAAPKYQSPK